MKTIDLEIALMKYFDIRRNLIVHNLTDWNSLVKFETDLLVLSKSGYATGVEIKITKADLKKDLKKDHIKYLNSKIFRNKTPTEIYYKNLKYFYYAVPEKLQKDTLNQIPDFCGLLVCHRMYDNDSTWNIIEEIRKPKFLFNTKWTDLMRYNLARLGAMRILGLKEKLNLTNVNKC